MMTTLSVVPEYVQGAPSYMYTDTTVPIAWISSIEGIGPRKTFQPFPKNQFCLPLDFGSGNRQPSTPIQRGY